MPIKKIKRKFTSLKPVSWGKEMKYISEEVDEIIYND